MGERRRKGGLAMRLTSSSDSITTTFWHNFDGPFYSNNGTYDINGIYLSAIFGTFVHSVSYRNACTCTLSTKYGMVNLCVNNGSFVNQFWHMCALRYL